MSFQTNSGSMDITARIGTSYYKFGIQLLGDRDGSRVEAIEHRHHRDAVRINTDILQEWIQGKGVQPVSWTSLTTVLEKCDLRVLASEIREAMELPKN